VMRLVVKSQTLPTTVFDLGRRPPPGLVHLASTSGFFNYALRGYGTGEDLHASGYFEAGGSWRGNLLFSGLSWPFTGGDPVRGLSYLELPWRERLQRLTLGDASATTGPLGGSVLVGGVTFAKGYDLDPYFDRYTSLGVGGSAHTPSTLDVYVNDQLVRREEIPPGPFRVDDLPLTDGLGRVRYVIRNAFGQATELGQSYYFATELLAPGHAREHEVTERAPALERDVLRQPAELEPAGDDDPARVRLGVAGQHLEQGRLARAVVADQTDPIALADPQIELVDDGLLAEAEGDFLEHDEAHGRGC